MKAIIGLGNPGPEYKGTRHNLGFEVVEELARRWNAKLKAWKSSANLAVVRDRGALLAAPTTFMNASGDAVWKIVDYHDIQAPDVLIVVDEIQLPVGRLRLRRSGSAGGHNGLKSVIQHLGDGFPRLRIGVGRGDPRWDLADHVLSRFATEERQTVEETIGRAADAAELFAAESIEAAMNRLNVRDDKASDDKASDEEPR
jgi:PTH1 family peptidyl-tRNA hydrolase